MRLSIITINYNNKQGLQETIDSVVSQTYKDIEWIIIDGGSTDGSRELIEENAQYFTYWCSEPDKGIYNAMNKGIGQATGEYCLFLNSGDSLYSAHTLENVLKEKYTQDFVYGYLINKENMKRKACFARENLTAADFFKSSLPHQATFMRKDVFDRYGLYDESCTIVSDWKFFLKTIVFENASIKYIDQPIAIFDNTGISSQKNKKLRVAEYERTLKELFPLRILADYPYVLSLKDVLKNRFSRWAYSLLYRCSNMRNV